MVPAMDIAPILDALRRPGSLDDQGVPRAPGVYAVYLDDAKRLGDLKVRGGLLFAGSGADLHGLVFGQHLVTGKTSDSALRRLLGAVLKTELSLTAQPRRRGKRNRKAASQYQFSEGQERQLTDWMRANLRLAFAEVPPGRIRDAEAAVIAALKPCLNVDGAKDWTNPQAQAVMKLRKACVDEADLGRQARG